MQICCSVYLHRIKASRLFLDFLSKESVLDFLSKASVFIQKLLLVSFCDGYANNTTNVKNMHLHRDSNSDQCLLNK